MQTKTKFSRAPRARALAVIALAASVLVTACGGGGGAPSFGISSSTPADGSSEVSRDAPLRLAFSAPVDPATVPGNVTLIGPTGRAAVESAGAGAEVEVRPVHRLMPMAEYELRLGAALRSAQGESPQGGTIRFRTRDGSWQSPQAVDTADLVDADRPHVAINAAGDAIAVWAQGEGIARGFWAARYTPGAGWGGPEPIAPAGAEVLVVAVAGMDAAGRAMVVWVEHEGNRRNLWARRHAVEGGWSVTEPVEQDDSGSAMKPQLAMSPSGHAT
ncbi:MAG TPA: Ig-like domain-containing protein, partial [Ramlibacter sp.]|nr:Ig-like domain-containing protein [Ramlibacter sp.]